MIRMALDGLLLLALVVWASNLLLRYPALLRSAQARAGIAFFSFGLHVPLVLALSSRQQSIIGSISTVSPLASRLGELLTLVTMVAGLSVVLSRSAVPRQGWRGVVVGLWALVLARVLSMVAAPAEVPAPFPRDTLMLALVVHAVAVSGVDRQVIIGWGRAVTRIITVVSAASAVVAPGWAYIGEGTNGYDRTLFGVPRLVGLAPHSGALSMVAIVGLLLELADGHGRRSGRVIGISSATICLLLTQSNTGWAAAAVGLVVMGVSHSQRFRAWSALGAVVAIPPALLLARDWFRPVAWLGGGDYVGTLSGRRAIWLLARQEFGRHPEVGYGPGFLGDSYRRTHLAETQQWASNAHNQVLQTLAETGLVGLAALALLVSFAVGVAWRTRRVDGGLALALLIPLLIFGVFGTPLYPAGLVAPVLVALVVVVSPVRVSPGLGSLTPAEGSVHPPPPQVVLTRP